MANINAKYKIYENGVWNVYHFETDASQIKSGTLASARLPSDVVKTTGAQSIGGKKTFTDQAMITKSTSADAGLTIKGSRPNLVFETDNLTGGVAFNIMKGVVNNATGSTQAGVVGLYGSASTTPPASYYMYFDSRPDGTYNNATLKVDSNDRVGIGLSSSTSPSYTLDVGGDIRLSGNLRKSSYVYTLPNKTGTLAMLDDIANDTNTTYTFASGTTAGAFNVTPSGGPLQTVSIYGLNIANWNTAYGWGNHASQGYLKSLSGAILTTGNQSATGVKTFSDGIVIPGADKYIDIGNKTNWFWTRFSGENWTFNNTYTGSGWARNLMEMVNSSDSAYFRIGAQGSGQSFSHMYIGPAYNNYWISLNDTRADLKVQLDMNSKKITALATPTANTDAATKKYVDDKVSAFVDEDTTYTVATGDANGQIKVTPSTGGAYNVNVKGLGTAAYTASTDYLTSLTGALLTNNSTQTVAGNKTFDGTNHIGGLKVLQESKNILGTTANATVFDTNKVWFQKGALFYGTALDAGLVTRGISGVNSTGSAKDNLYINYDGNNTYSSTRQLVLQAGAIGTHYGNNLYQYAAARGDAVKDYADATYAAKTHTHSYASITNKPTKVIRESNWNSSTKVWTLEVLA